MIQRLLLYFLLVFFIPSCSLSPVRNIPVPHSYISHNFAKIEKEFAPFVLTFEKHYKKSISIPIKFAHLRGDIIGTCYCMGCVFFMKFIEIDYKWWKSRYTTSLEKELVILHELGHCILNREHDETKVKRDGKQIRKTLMNKINFGNSSDYLNYRRYYLKELFNPTYK